MTGLNLKPTVSEEKLDQKKVRLQQNFFATSLFHQQLLFKEKVIGSWTIEKEERCNICWVNIKQGEPFTRCTSCNNKFHTDHWQEWIRSKQTCPICKVKILG